MFFLEKKEQFVLNKIVILTDVDNLREKEELQINYLYFSWENNDFSQNAYAINLIYFDISKD